MTNPLADRAAVATTPAPDSVPPITPLRFTALVRVETRKILDIPSGRGVLVCVAALAVVVSIWQLFTSDQEQLSVPVYLMGPVQMVCMITPLIGLITMTSEFTQRTALSTFTLAPWRLRVLWAKAIAATAVTIATTIVAIAIAMVGAWTTSAITDTPAMYNGVGDTIRGLLLTSILTSILALAIGALVAQTAIAASVYFIAPVAFSVLATAVLKDAAPWFDIFAAFDRLGSNDPFVELGQTGTSLMLWVVIPAVLGAASAVRREIK